MVRYNCINRTIFQCFANCFNMIFGAQGRGNTRCSIIVCTGFIGKSQMMYSCFTSYRYATLFSLTDYFYCSLTCYMCNMDMCAGILSNQNISCYCYVFSKCRYARYADARGYDTLVHIAVAAKFMVN